MKRITLTYIAFIIITNIGLAHNLDSNQSDIVIEPDTTQVRELFLTPGFLNDAELTEFNILWTKALNSGIWEAYETSFLMVFEYSTTNVAKAILVTALLDPAQNTSLGEWALNEISKSKLLQYRFSNYITILKLEEEGKQLEEELKQLEELIWNTQ